MLKFHSMFIDPPVFSPHLKSNSNKANFSRWHSTSNISSNYRYKNSNIKLVYLGVNCEIFGGDVKESKKRLRKVNLERKHGRGVIVSSSSSNTTSSTIGFIEDGDIFGVSEFGWEVRRLVKEDNEEMREVVQIQAEAFHDPMPFFNDIFFEFFKAEVLSGLLYKIRNSAPNRYACLVAEPADASNTFPRPEQGSRLVGVADVTVLRDKEVLQHLEGAEEYLYVSGIAVFKEFRRQKVGTALLKGCDFLSKHWGFEYLALRAYEDDSAACKLYFNAGYKIVSKDPVWLTTWIGRKRRVLMIKRYSTSCMYTI